MSDDKYSKLKQKHGAALLKVQANKNKIKQGGTVKSWMEVFVLLNEENPKFQQPVQAIKTDAKRIDPLLASGLVPIPGKNMTSPQLPQKLPQQQQQAKPKVVDNRPAPPAESIQAPKTGLKAYEALPTPQNPKMVLAHDRLAYDKALEEQLQFETKKLQEMIEAKFNPKMIAKQKEQVDQLIQQRELVERQKEQAQKSRTVQIREAEKRAAAEKALQEAKANPAPLEGERLERALREFFKVNEPEALEDGRVEAVLMWTEERGVEKLCAMLREQYGVDLYGKQNIENTAADQVQADLYARRLLGFYKAHKVTDMAKFDECLKVGQWTCKVGEAALNAKLRAKYNDDLDSYGQKIMLTVEPQLRKFYQKWNPEIIEKGLGPLLAWVVSNGIDAMNDMLMEKYGEDLNGRKGHLEEKSQFQQPGPSARAILHRELIRDDSLSKIEPDDLVKKRKEILIKQLASFLEVKDPQRLQQGGLAPLVQWAIPRSDQQVDDLLMESDGADLEEAGLRRFSFDEDEVKSFDGKGESGLATSAAKVASIQMEDEFKRAEIRSVRASTDERPVSRAISDNFADIIPEPEF